MNRGVVNMFTGEAVKEGATPAMRWQIMAREVACVVGKTISGGCGEVWVVGVVVGFLGLMLGFRARKFGGLMLLELAMAALGLYKAGRVDYSSDHYILFVVPGIVVMMGLWLSWIASRGKWWVVGLIVVYIWVQVGELSSDRLPSSYAAKQEVVDEVLALMGDKQMVLQIWDQEVLSYDFLFYEELRSRGLDYGRVSLLERWSEGNPEVVIFHKERPPKTGVVKQMEAAKLLFVDGESGT
jgi:hypothetical protein